MAAPSWPRSMVDDTHRGLRELGHPRQPLPRWAWKTATAPRIAGRTNRSIGALHRKLAASAWGAMTLHRHRARHR